MPHKIKREQGMPKMTWMARVNDMLEFDLQAHITLVKNEWKKFYVKKLDGIRLLVHVATPFLWG